jgi:DNA processing protein
MILTETEPTTVDLESTVRLSLIPGIGPRTRMVLLERFGTPAGVFAAPVERLRQVPGVGGKLSLAITQAQHEVDVGAELQLCQEHGIQVIARESEPYPLGLRTIPDPPGILFCRGQLEPRDAIALAIVGTRHATQYGLRHAERLAEGLSRAGFTIVSGLARGIDTAAHRGALQAGGRTIAVLGSGLLRIYPPENRKLSEAIAASGALLSEAPIRSRPLRGAFPQRNRLISGLSLGLIVLEAGLRSGALISAHHALEQGREVFAVPGPIDSHVSRGCHQLIREGAKLVETIEDVLEELGPLATVASLGGDQEIRHPAELQLNDQERSVLNAIGSEPTTIEQVVATSGLPVARVLSTASVLEMRHLVRRLSGQLLVRY